MHQPSAACTRAQYDNQTLLLCYLHFCCILLLLALVVCVSCHQLGQRPSLHFQWALPAICIGGVSLVPHSSTTLTVQLAFIVFFLYQPVFFTVVHTYIQMSRFCNLHSELVVYVEIVRFYIVLYAWCVCGVVCNTAWWRCM